MLSVILALQLTVFVVNSAMGFFVLRSNPRAQTNLLYALFSFSLALWNISIFFIILGVWPQLIWARLGFSFGVVMATALFYFTVIFHGDFTRRLWLDILLGALTLVLFSLTLTRQMVSRVEVIGGHITGDLGPVLALFTIYVLLAFFGGLSVLIYKYKKTKGIARQQFLYVLTGFTFFITTFLTTNLILPVFFGIFQFNNLGPLFSLPMVALIGYAIVRHELMDIRIVIQRGLIYAVLLIIISGLYLLLIGILGYIFKEVTDATMIVSGALTAIAGVLGAPVVERYFRRLTDKIFFKDKYDYSEAMHDLSEILNNGIEQAAIIEASSKLLKKIFKTEAAEIFVAVNYPEMIRDGEVKLIKGGAALEAPLSLESRPMGKIMLGEKLSGDPYTKEDIKLLETFAYQAAVTLEKARLYEEVKAYSEMLEERVIERTKQIEGLQEEQKQMMVDIAHGLQTPLTVLKGRLAFLEKRLGGNGEVRTFEKSVDEVSKFIYDLLNLARLEGGGEDFRKEKVDLSGLLDELVEYFSTLAGEKGIEIVKNIEPRIFILGDQERISELVTNLVSNAFKYMSPSGIKRIVIALRKVNRSAELTLEDTGLGIGKKDLPNIFKRFYRVEGAGGTEPKGTGLGLAIAKEIVEKHGGTIEAESELGKGTKFTVRFKARE